MYWRSGLVWSRSGRLFGNRLKAPEIGRMGRCGGLGALIGRLGGLPGLD